MSVEEPHKPSKVRADPHRVMAWIDIALERRSFQVVFLIQLILLLSFLLGPRFWNRKSITANLRVGERAEGNIKASRSFDYFPSVEKVEKERESAAARTLPVFDHQIDLGAIIIERIGRAFNRMTITDARVGAANVKVEAQAESKNEEERQQLNNLLQAEVSPDVFLQLKKSNFSAEAKASLLSLIGLSMSQMIVAHRGALVPFQGGPITVRHLANGRAISSSSEERITNFSRIKDLQQIREELRTQAPVYIAKLPSPLGKIIVGLAQDLAMPNLAFNQEETETRREDAREAIKARPVSLVKGQIIIRDGEPITKEDLSILRAMDAGHRGVDVVQVLFGLGCIIFLTLIIVFRYAKSEFRRFLIRSRDPLAISILLVGLLCLTKFALTGGEGLSHGQQDLRLIPYAMPIAGGAMLVRLLISAEAAALFSTVLAVLCGLIVDQNLSLVLFYWVTGLMGAAGVRQVQSRSTILQAGLYSGLAGALMVLGFRMFREQLLTADTVYSIMSAVGGGLLASFITLALLPAMEWLFDYTTDVTLLELANLNHPLLRDLILRAPGTYHHSMIVGHLSEAACDAIGANGLLARVACFYHDIGKIKNADYFAENFKPSDSPHSRLKPSMSGLIIRSHVKDTIEMLRAHGLPELVIDTATQHHGTTLIEYFYHKALEAKEPDEEVHEEDYRYGGPKPQTREAGIIMLADGVEAASRSLAETSEDRLTGVVQRVINNKFTDGQLDHCDLTLRDMHLIAKSFLQVLRGIYHQRPTYPWQHQRREETKRPNDDQKRESSTARLKAVERPAIANNSSTTEGEKATAKVLTHPQLKSQAKNEKKPKNDGKSDKDKDKDKKAKNPERIATPGIPAHKTKEENKSERENKRNDESSTFHAQSPGEKDSQELIDLGIAPEAPPESNADIKRLGLS